MKRIRIFIFFISILVIKVGYCQTGFIPEFQYRPTLDKYWKSFENGVILNDIGNVRQKLLKNGIKQVLEIKKNCTGDTISSITTERNLVGDTISVYELNTSEKYAEHKTFCFSNELLIEERYCLRKWSENNSICDSGNFYFIYKHGRKFPNEIIQIENGDTISRDQFFFFNSGLIKSATIYNKSSEMVFYNFKCKKNNLYRYLNDSLELQVTFDKNQRPLRLVNNNHFGDLNIDSDTITFCYLDDGTIIINKQGIGEPQIDVLCFMKEELYMRHIFGYVYGDDYSVLYGTYLYNYLDNGLLQSKTGTSERPFWCATSQDINVVFSEFYYSYF